MYKIKEKDSYVPADVCHLSSYGICFIESSSGFSSSILD